jgi:carboxypeptidase C (cathepsin A)
MKRDASILLLVLLLLESVALAASGPLRVAGFQRELDAAGSAPSAVDRRAPSPEDSVTEHTILVNGQAIRYKATAGYMPIASGSDKPVAHLFFVAYERQDGGQSRASVPARQEESCGDARPTPRSAREDRPITFAFNGGPGAASVWLHVGAFGPQRVLLANDGTALPSSEEMVDNEFTWLAFTDLVFVDPVGTGFSYTAPGVDASQFYEVQKDIEIAAEFVRLFVTRHERWLSPQFVVGESYGTTRAVGMARHLQDRYALYLHGLILLSSALDLQVISFDPGNDLPYVLSLPSYTAVASYHGKLGKKLSSDLGRSLQTVQAWALDDYITALAKGASLAEAERQEIARRLAEYTGLSEDVIAGNHLRISTFGFAQELLGRERRVLGLLDGRVTAPSLSSPGRPWTDPSLFIVKGPFVAAFNSYVRAQLGFHTDRPYIFLSDKINESWNWGPARRGYLNVAPSLAEAMSLDNRLKVFAAAGDYDLTTPWLGQEYVFNHLDLPAGLRPNITFRRYRAGHQIYTSPQALQQLTADVRTFVIGPAEIAAIGNGNPLSIEPFQADYRKLFYGKAMLILRTKAGQGGKVRAIAESDGLTAAETVVSVSK